MIIYFLFLLIIFFILKKKKIYYSCNPMKLNIHIKNLFSDLNYVYTPYENWDIYLPYSYTFLENELNIIKKSNKKRIIDGINNCDIICGKDYLCNFLIKNYGRIITDTIIPKTYVIKNNSDIYKFIKDYSDKDIYLLKNNIQKKKGITFYNNKNEILKNKNNYKIIQKYVNNQIIIMDRRLSLRIYVLLIFKNNKKDVYISKYGKCLYSNLLTDKKNTNFEELIANTYPISDIYKKYPLNYQNLKKIFGKKNFNKLDNNIIRILILIFSKALKHLGNNKNFKNDICYQLFGADFILTDKYYPYLLEINKGPELSSINLNDFNLKKKIILDIFEKIGLFKYNTQENSFLKIISSNS